MQPVRREERYHPVHRPRFPVQKQQLVVMGQKYETFDVYDYRGDKLKDKLESYLKRAIFPPLFTPIQTIPAGYA